MNHNKIIKFIVLTIIVAGLIWILTTFFNQNEASSENEKNKEEIIYLDRKLISIINYLNNIQLQNYKISVTKVEAKSNSGGGLSKGQDKEEQKKDNAGNKEETEISKMEEETIVTDTEKIDWEAIEAEIEILYSVWPTMVLDLYSLDINKEDVLEFSNTLDDVMQNIRKKDKTLSAMYIAKLYGYLPKFIDKGNENELQKKLLETKTYIINAYSYAETQNFDKMEGEIIKAEGIFANLVNDAKLIKDKKKYNINKTYILIEELKKSITRKDVEIFYVKYKNTLEELNNLF